MNYLDEYADYYEDREYARTEKAKPTRRRWRDIERFFEQKRLFKEIVPDDESYFDMLEKA